MLASNTIHPTPGLEQKKAIWRLGVEILRKEPVDMIPKNTFRFFIQHFFTNNTFLIFASLIVLVFLISGLGH